MGELRRAASIFAHAIASGRQHIITRTGEEHGIGLSLLRLERPFKVRTSQEGAWVLLRGSVRFGFGEEIVEASRGSLFADRPTMLHAPSGVDVELVPGLEGAELAWAEVASGEGSFDPRLYLPDEVRCEQRGKGRLEDASHREVRTIVDDDNGPPASRLVVGEVVTKPGRWSSYPPHHHPQPEIYHYRFTREQGYGHAELGEQVVKVRKGDTTLISPGETHAQCAAPGYGMWYLWVIRHLPNARYTIPVFEPEHRWTMASGAVADSTD